MNKTNTSKTNMNKLRSGYRQPQLDPIPHTNQMVYRNGQGPPGQVFIIPRAVLIAGFYRRTAIPAWTDVAEQILRVHLESCGADTWYLPAPRRILRKEAAVADFFLGLITWMQGGAKRGCCHRVLYEAIRRLPGQAWFQETAANAAYLQLWCQSVIQGKVAAP